jgi:cyanophycin synthetase
LLVVGNKLVAAVHGSSESVVGDGVQTIEQLVAEANRDPRRGEAYTDPLGVIKLDAAALIEIARQGLTIDSIPHAGLDVVVRRTGDLTTDCTDEVHPETAEQAVLAARVVGLDIAGLDILASDIRKPLDDQRGAVVEVNAGPSLSPHVNPLFGKPQKVGDAIVEMLFPNNAPSQIPIIGIIHGRTSVQLLKRIADELTSNGIDYGLVGNSRAGVNGRTVDTGCLDDAARVMAMLCNPMVKTLLVQLDPATAADSGIHVPRLDHLFISREIIESIRINLDMAGLISTVHAVAAHGQIYSEEMTPEFQRWIELHKHPSATVNPNYETFFAQLDLACA